jgi:hypothetical protein
MPPESVLVCAPRHFTIFFDRQIDVAGQRLRNHANRSPYCVRLAGDIMAGHHGSAAGHGRQCRHHADQRTFAGAVGAKQPKNLPVVHVKRDAVDRSEIAVALHNVFDRDGHFGLVGIHCFTSLSFGM